jgi:cell division protein FtsQ
VTAVAAVAGGAYVLSARTSLFAVREIDVRGVRPAVAERVRVALTPLVGSSLVGVRGRDVSDRLDALPEIVSASVDRAFPHTLRVVVRSERPVAVLRRGRESWLVSARGRVMRELATARRSSLPRIWLAKDADVEVGRMLGVADGGRAARALAPLAGLRFPAVVRSAEGGADRLRFVLRSGLELRLGNPRDLRLKLAVARRILLAGTQYAYVDVSVPERPVALAKAQVEG